jgi:hypothetical protein
MRTFPTFPAALIVLAMLGSASGVACADAIRDGKERESERFEREAGMRFRGAESEARDRMESRASWLRALRLDEREDGCVAFDPGQESCLVTVAAFNGRAEDWPVPAAPAGPESLEAQVRSRRKEILGTLLSEPYLQYRMAADPARDSLQSAWRDLLAKRQAADGPGDSVLRALYQARFDSDFRSREEAIIQVLAMSDSVLADSLAAALRDNGSSAADAWRWGVPDSADLPSSLRAMAKGLKRGGTAGPFKTPYGWVFLGCASVRRQLTVAFADALPALLELAQASRNAAPPTDSAVSAYYRRHRREFIMPDTVRLAIRLIPERSARAGEDVDSRPEGNELGLDDSDLPLSLRGKLRRFLRGSPGDTSGPVPSAFGAWHIRILEPPRAGRLPGLAEARPLILERMSRDRGDAPSAVEMKALRDRQAWALMAASYLERSSGNGAASATDVPARSLASDRAAWMRERLRIRFIDPG